ncbi:MAG: RagB/SusD family nutrient uptake outer membrane protein [Bacteroidia bacterium]|nr:RagB/SusD family nutrient uptake outer membrane protein [Bacteroidia bacterium]
MKKLLYISFLTIILTTLGSCNDFLEHDAYGHPTSANAWVNDADILRIVDGLRVWQAREGIDGRGFMWFENCSDNMVTGRAQAEGDQIKNFQMQPTNGRDARQNWQWMYATIAVANDILGQVDHSKQASEAVKNSAKAQAHFYRGFAYLWLAPWYGDNGANGGIPIVTEKTPVEELDMARPKSVLENYDLIISDLRKAGDMLPYHSQLPENQWGRPHKAAAWGYAARAALYAAQYDSKYYDIVIEMADKIINMSGTDKRSLYADYRTFFREDNNFSPEYIFSVFGTHKEGPKFHGMSFQKDGYGLYNTWGYFQPTLDLYEAFEEGDTRRDATILLPGQHIQFISRDIHYGVNPSDVQSLSGMTFRKWLHPFQNKGDMGIKFNSDGNNQSTRMGMVLLRYADILLMKAEALIWSRGEGNGEAVSLINQVRTRAGLPANSRATKAQLMNERRCEFAFEFQPSRHLDMVRWGVAKNAYAKPLFGLRRKHTVAMLDLTAQEISNLGAGITNATYLSDIEPTKLSAQKRKLFNQIYEANVEKDKGYVDRPGNIIEGWVKDTIWNARTFDPTIHHVFPIPQAAINSSTTLKQNSGY